MLITDFLIRILMAVFLGFIIGTERQLTGHSSGVRINILVSLGSCMFVLFPMVMGSDDLRSAAQIITGVGFLCSGIIFKDGLNVRGLNTAATIWCTAAIGVLCSSGNILISCLATTVLILSNLLFRPIAKKLKSLEYFDESERYYKISVICLEIDEMKIRTFIMNYIRDSKLLLTNLESADIVGNKVEIEATLLCEGKRKDEIAEDLITKISIKEGVTSVGWELI